MTITRNFNLHLNAGASIPLLINANQYDSGEEWVFTLYSDRGVKYTPASGAIIGLKSDGHAIANNATVNGSGQIVVTETEQMTASVGKNVFELSIDSGTHGTANFIVLVEPQPYDESTASDSDLSLFEEAIEAASNIKPYGSPLVASTVAGMTDHDKVYVYTGSETGYTSGHWYYWDGTAWADGGVYNSVAVQTDTTLTLSGVAADSKKVGDELADLKEQIESSSGLTTDIKDALLQLAQKVSYIDANGQDYYDDLHDALYPPIPATAISLSANSISWTTTGQTQQLTATLTPATSTDTVSWSSSDTSVATVSSTGLVTGAALGSATITATAGSVSATCSVVIAQATVTSISAVYTQSGTVYDTDSLDDLKSDLVVTATWSDSTTSTVASNVYTLSGTLTEGTSTITVSYSGKTTTFTVNVTHSVLPSGYTELDYVSTASNTTSTPIYVATGVIPSANTSFEYKISRDAVPYDNNNDRAGHLASCENFYVPFWKYENSYANRGLKIANNRCGTENPLDYSSYDITLAANTPFEISAYMNGTNNVYVDETLIGTVSAGNNAPTKQLTLFTYDGITSTQGYLFKGKLYYMNIYENGVKIREFIPCKNPSNVVGLFDGVNNVFYQSATNYPLVAPSN